ncbi:MAG: putative signal peptide protein [Myxococcaceae bacterium]|nr:putative signal peptide protein [Myxococcaceae bacterium]
MTDKATELGPRRPRWARVLIGSSVVLLGLGAVLLPRTRTPAQMNQPALLAVAPPGERQKSSPAVDDAHAVLPHHAPQELAAPPPPPVSLTGSDGSGLELVSLSANAVIEDPLAFTELRIVFKNPEARVREGRFRITLPSGATISRFAMRIGDRFQEGEVVEQQAARVAYEDFLHRRQDPALLESEAGNEFSARVFPIPAHATKELIVSYSQELTRRDEAYRLPLRGLPKLGQLSIRALVQKDSASGAQPASSLGGQRAQHEIVQVDKSDFMPDRDFEVAHSGSAARLGLRHDNLVAARIVPLSETGARDAVSSLFVLVDTSASRALGLEEQLRATERLLAELARAEDSPITVATFDQSVAQVFRGRASALGDSLRKAVSSRRALGASDLDGTLAWLAAALGKQRHARVLLVSDGVATAGETGADKLRARVKALAAVGVERLDVLAVGGIRDDQLLSRLVTAGLPRDGAVLDASRPALLLSQKLTRATRSGIKLEIDGAGWVWPSVLHGVQPGDELMVYADLPTDRPFAVKIDGKPLPLSGALASVERPLLERAWVKARINRLSEQRDDVSAADRDLGEAMKKQIIELSTKYRVLSPFTSLLVLETEQDYARFGIERRALADILSIDAAGIALLRRGEIAVATDQPPSTEGARHADRRQVSEPGSRNAADLLEKAASSAPAPRGALSAEPVRAQAAAPAAQAEGDARGYAAFASAGGALAGVGATGAVSGARGAANMARSAAAPARSRVAASGPAPAPALGARSADEWAPRQQAEEREAVAVARPEPKKAETAPIAGELKAVMDLLRGGKKQAGLARALSWRERDASDVLALVALGEAWESLSELSSAARAYGSIIDLFPGRADMRRFAGERLERVRTAAALALAVDTYTKAVEQRPDHPASHRLLGFALLKQGRPREAFEALLKGVQRSYPSGRFRGVERILSEDLGLAAAAWIKHDPAQADDIRARLAKAGGTLEDAPSLRFVLNWETDANDVDFHIHDAEGGHAYYSAPQLPSGGELYADVTTGYGPECFTIRGPSAARSYPYRLQAHYYSRGPMGYGMGKVEVVEHDGKGTLRFEEHPFVVMQDGAYVALGTVSAPSRAFAR